MPNVSQNKVVTGLCQMFVELLPALGVIYPFPDGFLISSAPDLVRRHFDNVADVLVRRPADTRHSVT